MAGKRESLERNTFQDANRAVSVEQNIGDSMQRVLDNSGNIHTDKNEVSLMASRNFKVWNSLLLWFFCVVVCRTFISYEHVISTINEHVYNSSWHNSFKVKQNKIIFFLPWVNPRILYEKEGFRRFDFLGQHSQFYSSLK